MIERLGLGKKPPEKKQVHCQTKGEFIELALYDDVDNKLRDAKALILKLDREMQKLQEMISGRDLRLEEGNKRRAQAKKQI